MNKSNKSITPVLAALKLFIEISVASILFVSIAGIAILVDKALVWLIVTFDVGPELAAPLKFVKYLIFLVDMALLVNFFLGACVKAWRDQWK